MGVRLNWTVSDNNTESIVQKFNFIFDFLKSIQKIEHI